MTFLTKYSICIIFVSLYLIVCSCSPKNNNEKIFVVEISFENEGDGKIDICDEFSIDFVQIDRTYEGKIIGCNLTVPDFSNDEALITVFFRHKEYILEFEDVHPEWLQIKKRMKWNFQVDSPPFDEVNNPEIDLENLSSIYYLEFHPLDGGQVVEIIKPIYK